MFKFTKLASASAQVLLVLFILSNAQSNPPSDGTTPWAPAAGDANWVNVVTFGAKGDGTTDDTKAFKDAAATGKKIFIPKPTGGFYKLTGAITVKNSVYGDGSMPEVRMFGANGSNGALHSIFRVIDYAGTGIIFQGLHLNMQYPGGGSGEHEACIEIQCSKNITVQFCNIEKAYGDGIYVGAFGTTKAIPDNILVQYNTISNPYRYNVGVTCGTNCTIRNNYITKITSNFVSVIDLEPNNLGFEYVRDILIEKNEFNCIKQYYACCAISMYDPPAGTNPWSGNFTIRDNCGTWVPNTSQINVTGNNGLVGKVSNNFTNVVISNNNNNTKGCCDLKGIFFNCSREVSVQAGGNLQFTFTYDNKTGSTATISYLKKPSWMSATNGNPTITGKAPNTPSVDTVIAVVTAGGKSDTLKLIITIAFYYSFEAESGSLTAPMIIKSDPAASGGQYIIAPTGSGSTVSPKIEATYSPNITQAGDYYVWLRVYKQTISVTANYGTFVGFNGTFSKPGIANKTAGQYEWIMYASPFKLNAGANQFIIGHGNQEVFIDKIIITNSPNPLPDNISTVSVLPGKSNMIQKPNLSVRIISNGNIEFIGNFGNGILNQLKVVDIVGRTVWLYKNQGSGLGNRIIWETKAGKSVIGDGLYFVVLESLKGAKKEAIRFSLVN